MGDRLLASAGAAQWACGLCDGCAADLGRRLLVGARAQHYNSIWAAIWIIRLYFCCALVEMTRRGLDSLVSRAEVCQAVRNTFLSPFLLQVAQFLQFPSEQLYIWHRGCHRHMQRLQPVPVCHKDHHSWWYAQGPRLCGLQLLPHGMLLPSLRRVMTIGLFIRGIVIKK